MKKFWLGVLAGVALIMVPSGISLALLIRNERLEQEKWLAKRGLHAARKGRWHFSGPEQEAEFRRQMDADAREYPNYGETNHR